MLRGTRIPNLRPYQRPLFTAPPNLCIKLKFTSLSEPQVSNGSRSLYEDSDDFLRWLEQKAGSQISSVLSIGKSAYGRSLFASKTIQTGDCILKVPYSVQVTPAHLLPEIKSLLGNEVGNIAKLAIVILVEQKFGQKSEWAPYVSCLPQPGEMHNMQGLQTHPCRVNPSLVHRILESFLTRNWLNHWLFTRDEKIVYTHEVLNLRP